MPSQADTFPAATADAAVAEAAMSWAYRVARVSGIEDLREALSVLFFVRRQERLALQGA